jgi:hypothetical protein
VQGEDRQGELDAHPERRQVRVAVQQVLADVRVVPQQLVDRALLDQRVRRRQQDHRRPAPAGAPGGLAHQQRAAAVQRCEHDAEAEFADREVPEQELPDEGCQQEQAQRGRYSSHAADASDGCRRARPAKVCTP